MDDLASARKSISVAEKEIDILRWNSDSNFEKIKSTAEKMEKLSNEAEAVINRCDEAYKIATTEGLAKAFDQRAKRLGYSATAWVFCLALSLIAGASLGSTHLAELSKVISSDPKLSAVLLHAVILFFGIGGPIWFGWISTKQIAQRFKPAEDYSYKASVAKAYEGYKKEASRLDPNFEHRLFSSALDRLQEAPLRLMEHNNHGSPFHEVFNSNIVKDAFNTTVNFGESVLNLAKDAIQNSKQKENEKATG